MSIVIKSLPEQRLAAIKHRGDPSKLSLTLDKLISWAKEQPIDLQPKAGKTFGFGYGDPNKVSPEKYRFDLGLSIPNSFAINGRIRERIIPAGRYATTTHNGSYDKITDTFYSFHKEWQPDSGENFAEFPCIFCYHNFESEVPQEDLITELWLLLK